VDEWGNKGMSEPAKDEAELMERVAEALYDNYDLDLPMSFTLAAIRAAGWAVVPVEPTDGLLMSMALRADHGLGCSGYYDVPGGEPWQTHARHLEMAISEARKQHEEVVGTGFYKPECNDTYRAMLAAAPGVKP
jgi:hypothetical protein